MSDIQRAKAIRCVNEWLDSRPKDFNRPSDEAIEAIIDEIESGIRSEELERRERARIHAMNLDLFND